VNRGCNVRGRRCECGSLNSRQCERCTADNKVNRGCNVRGRRCECGSLNSSWCERCTADNKVNRGCNVTGRRCECGSLNSRHCERCTADKQEIRNKTLLNINNSLSFVNNCSVEYKTRVRRYFLKQTRTLSYHV